MQAEAKSDSSPHMAESESVNSSESKPKPESFFARCLRRWINTIDHVSSSFLGGPRCIKFAHVINFQKCTTIFLCVGMMVKSKNFSSTATTYTALHGSYGLCWFMKHLVFPDPRWESKMTVGSAISVFATVLGPYWIIAYNAIMGDAERTNIELCAAAVVYAVGLALMFGADAQKYFVLRERKGLITDGFFARTRNPNYLGEVMIYGSFAYVSAHGSSWAIVGGVWTFLFLPWMLGKDMRMSRHSGWKAYSARSGLFFPRLL
jgi:protein-S-isoprenylcysteine O-methyltransferase Ste14